MLKRIMAATAAFSLFGLVTAATADDPIRNLCKQGIARCEDAANDCSVNEMIGGKKICFTNENAKAHFIKQLDPSRFQSQGFRVGLPGVNCRCDCLIAGYPDLCYCWTCW